MVCVPAPMARNPSGSGCGWTAVYRATLHYFRSACDEIQGILYAVDNRNRLPGVQGWGSHLYPGGSPQQIEWGYPIACGRTTLAGNVEGNNKSSTAAGI